uniref:Pyruvate/2-oxoglutarate dehydrogenase complex, dihydrolipoamide dehydrogenase component n=1 Tax=Desulfovibrio sp. U5L TaxID=596152 RepID=I2Q3Y7_9BACT
MARAYDLIVLGAGPASGPAARLCREAGWTVAVVEAGRLGGVCPNVGCNPKKVLMSAPETLVQVRHLLGKGLSGEPRPDWAALMAFKRSFTRPVDARVEGSLREAGIDIVRGRAVFTGRRAVAVGGEELTARKILLAVGATPSRFGFPGADRLATSDDFLDLDALPGRVAFVGGGFIAFELAHIAAACGARATILTHGDAVLRRFDQDLVARLLAATRARRIEVRLGAPVTAIRKEAEGLAIDTPNGPIRADMAVNAAGRPANLDGLGLEAAGVARSKAGITVNDHLQSPTNPDVYAAGDCLDAPYALTPTADLESRIAGENMLSGNTRTIDRTGTPSVLFTLPPLAMAGLTEADCQARGIPYRKKEYDLADSFPWQRLGETTGFAKTLVSPDDDRILGAHILGHGAEEMINAVALAMRQHLPAKALREAVWAYPTCGYYLRYMF